MWHQRLAFQQLQGIPPPPTRPLPIEKTRNVNMPTLAHGIMLKDGTAVNADRITDDLVVSQCPPKAAMYDFWRMVMEQHVQTIICLAQPEDYGGFRPYFPDLPSDIKTFHSIEVMTCTHVVVGPLTIRSIGIVDKATGDMQFLMHVHAPWPDGCPPPNQRVATDLLDVLKTPGQKIVHCAAGVGRAGTLVAMHLLRLNPRSEPYDVVVALRSRRVGAVHTLQQFSFLYEFNAAQSAGRERKDVVEVSSVPLVSDRYRTVDKGIADALAQGHGDVFYLQDVQFAQAQMPRWSVDGPTKTQAD
jgi:hypothetical protein